MGNGSTHTSYNGRYEMAKKNCTSAEIIVNTLSTEVR